MGLTLYDKLWARHRIAAVAPGVDLLHVDRHYLYEPHVQSVTGLAARGIAVRAPARTVAVMDHVVASSPGRTGGPAYAARLIEGLRRAATGYGMKLLDLGSPEQGITHVAGPELGLTQPGMLVVCGDSHTTTHGALGVLCWGIGSTEIETVLATQAIVQKKARSMRVRFEGELPRGAHAKDMALALIGRHGAAHGSGFAVEFAGDAVAALDVEGRMTLCNMAIEFGAKFALVGVDAKTIAYASTRPYAPRGPLLAAAQRDWVTLASDTDARFDREIAFDVSRLAPQVTWGVSPEHCATLDATVPRLADAQSDAQREDWRRALEYMGLREGQPLAGTPVDQVFIGSCTNSRLSDLRVAAAIVRGRKVAPGTRAWVVPGSGSVKAAAEREGLAKLFVDSGFEWREPGCSMCVGMNGDILAPGQRCVSTSNRNFIGRQGPGVRTHLASPATAAASAIEGRLADPRAYLREAAPDGEPR